jgi:hypothetical protein
MGVVMGVGSLAFGVAGKNGILRRDILLSDLRGGGCITCAVCELDWE